MNVFDFKVARYNGTDHLTWTSMGHYEHYFSDMKNSPDVVAFIADSSYNIQKKVTIEEGGKPNLHEFSIIDGGKSAILAMGKRKREKVSSVTSKYPDGV